MSGRSKARRRQAATGEGYQLALSHIRGHCHKCARGEPCDGCKKEPCWSCLPDCTMVGQKCRLDNLQANGSKACVYCGRTYL